MEVFALLDDCNATAARPTSRLYRGFVREWRCADPRQLDRFWAAAERDLRSGRHAVVLADYEWGARLLQTGDQEWGAEEPGALRLLLFSSLDFLSRQEVDAWLATWEAESLADGQQEPALARPIPDPRDSARQGVGKNESDRATLWHPGGDLPDAVGGGVPPPAAAGVFDVRASLESTAFATALDRIHDLILAGETYQVNYTYRLDFQVFGAPFSLYRRLRASQPVAFGALLALPPATQGDEPTWVLSCSPELFLRHRAGRIMARPMKGTAPRASAAAADDALAGELAANAKTRAENLMIVDLLRNDLGRLARTGSVRVPALFAVEAHPSLWQMTSTIEADLPPGVTFPQVLRATFPCGSITGAPKHRTMHLIRQLETRPRGLYTGAIGWIDPIAINEMAAPVPSGVSGEISTSGMDALPDLRIDAAPTGDLAGVSTGVPVMQADEVPPACGDFCLSVAIRTLTLGAPVVDSPLAPRPGTLGIGAGIVSDSQAGDEYAECQLKARFLTGLDPGFTLFETLLATRATGIHHLDRHLARLGRSADCLGFRLPLPEIRRALAAETTQLPTTGPFRLRLDLHKDGRFTLTSAPLNPLPPGPVGLLIAREPMDEADPLLGHKTSRRARYDAAIATAVGQGAFDMLFCNRQGLVTEGGRSNLFVRLDGAWLTPPLSAGLLPGVLRGLILEDPAWKAREAPLTLADLRRADQIRVCNALRGLIEARLLDSQSLSTTAPTSPLNRNHPW